MAKQQSLKEINNRMELYNLFMRAVRKMREENKRMR
jgi:hypothetical protein